ncbi:MAG TPA: nuclear transport factor 2 family protein [Actinomycetota bacterium]|nr:nuclear transport factor 2 family protein [Actinomycetota bacterium]
MAGEKAQKLGEAMGLMSRGEVQRFGEVLLADDVVWHWPGRSSVSGEYRGREAALGLLQGFQQLTGGQLNIEPMDILEGQDHLMSFTHVTAEREGDSLDVIMADAMRFGPDGRVAEYWTLSNDQEAVDRFIG